MKKILALTRYEANGASSRLRFFQYIDYFEKTGLTALSFKAQSLLSEKYIHQLYQKKQKSKWQTTIGYCKRLFFLLFNLKKYDLIWAEKELFPYCPARLELWLLRNKKFVLDYDDAIFHNYDQHSLFLVRKALKNKITLLMKKADVVFCGNHYIATKATAAEARSIVLFPTVICLQKYAIHKKETPEERIPVIGWIGTPATQKNLLLLNEALTQLSEIKKFKLLLIGAHPAFSLTACNFEIKPWSEDTEVTLLKTIDIGIMPLVDAAFERGKCGYKLIQYMACAKPVVASPIGVNNEIVDEGINGYLAQTSRDWFNALLILLNNSEQRKAMGAMGRKKVEEHYCLERTAPKLWATFNELI